MPSSNDNALANPFRYGGLALDEAFADREREVAELVADVRNGQDVVVFAPRRYGKTSLVWRAAGALARRRVLVAQVDLMTTPTKEKLAEKLAAAIYEHIASRLERAREAALAPFRALRVQPVVTLDPVDGSLSFSFSFGRTPADIDATQELAYFLWEETAPGAAACSGDLERALAAVLRSEHAHFSLLWESCAKAQRLLLEALAREQPGRPFTSGYRAAHGLPSVPTMQKAARALLEREVVRRDAGVYEIAEPFLADWIRASIRPSSRRGRPANDRRSGVDHVE